MLSNASKHFTHLGIQFSRDQSGAVILKQTRFIDDLVPVRLSSASAEEIETQDLPPSLRNAAQSLIGSLLWLASNTRLDIAGEASILAGSMRNPTFGDARAANKLLRYVQFSRLQGLTMPVLSGLLEIRMFSDAALQIVVGHG